MISLGAVIIAISVLVFMYNVWRSLRNGRIAGDNPWRAATLEWSTSSPPPHYNFAEVPQVTSRMPLWEEHEGASVGAAQATEHRHEEEEVHVPMPAPSYWPLVLSAMKAMVAGSLLIWEAHNILGLTMISFFGAIGVYSIYRWSFEPPFAEGEGAGH